MKNSDSSVLKGQHNLAQGIALGLQTGLRFVRDKMITKEKFPFRTKGMISFLRQKMTFYCVRNKIFALNIIFSRTGFVLFQFPGRCPGLVYFGPSGRKKIPL